MSEQAKSAAESFAENFTEATDTTAAPESPAEAVSTYLDAGKQYGTNRSLHVPDGKVEQAHFHTVKPSAVRGHSRAFSRHGSVPHSGGRRTYSDSLNGSWQSKASTATGMSMDDCVSSGWWNRFWHVVGGKLSDRR